MNLYQVLEIPVIYRTVQSVLAPGMDRIVTDVLSQTLSRIRTPAAVLDVGCGPSSWLSKFGMNPVGLDLCHAYSNKFRVSGNLAVTGSATMLPFSAGSFDLVFSYGLLHHLPEALARESIAEIIRVTCAGGHVIIFDPMLPRAAWKRPQAWALCNLDRGRFIRHQELYESSILRTAEWKTKRFTHSYLGTEGVLSTLHKTG